MVKIRLRRMGAKKVPSYRLVVADSRMPRDGRFIESIGYYNPTREPVVIEIEEEKALTWLNQGAQASETVIRLFKQTGIWDKFIALKGKDKEAVQA
jgi:small subunit ribosomal protein S16